MVLILLVMASLPYFILLPREHIRCKLTFSCKTERFFLDVGNDKFQSRFFRFDSGSNRRNQFFFRKQKEEGVSGAPSPARRPPAPSAAHPKLLAFGPLRCSSSSNPARHSLPPPSNTARALPASSTSLELCQGRRASMRRVCGKNTVAACCRR